MLDRSSTVIDHQKMRLHGSVIRILSLVDPFNVSDSVGGLFYGIIGLFRSLEDDRTYQYMFSTPGRGDLRIL